VTAGHGLDLLRSFLRSLPRSRTWDDARHESTEVHIDDSFHVDGVGTVLAGTINRGKVSTGDNLLLGPDRVTGAFQPVIIR
jgi:elongation factor 1-alpha